MRVLLTNDDGIDAPGLSALRSAAAALGEVVVVAPAQEWSGCGHRVTTHAPIAIEARAPATWVVHGTPADCVRIALEHLRLAPAWVVAGINAGGNLGADVHVSGTVAAAREAALHGLPALAVSHYIRRGLALDWPRAAAWTAPLLAELITAGCPAGRLLNVNLPHLDAGAPPPPARRVPLDPSPLPVRFTADAAGGSVRYAGDYHRRAQRPGHDVATCFGGAISVSELAL